jgi:hypothetical protein
MASPIGLLASAHASSNGHPWFTSFVWTSARLTVLATALTSRSAVSFSCPGSPLMMARIAEASSTTLFTLSRLAAFREQFLDERLIVLYISSGAPLSALYTVSLRADSQFIILDSQHNLISNVYAKRFAKRRRNNDAAIFIDSCLCFVLHDIII